MRARLLPAALAVAGLCAAFAAGCSEGTVARPQAVPDGTQSLLSVDRTTGVQANGTDSVTITVTARDANGTPIPNVFVTLAVTGTGNNLQPPLAPTNANGQAAGTLASQSVDTKQISGSLTVSAANAKAVAIVQTATVTFVTPTAGGPGGGNTGGGAPVVASFGPTSGPVGTAVTIGGTGFAGTTFVTFGATKQTVFTVTSPNQISTTVPAGAQSGQISVTTPAGTGVSATAFTVGTGTGTGSGGSKPTVTGLSPSSGAVGASVVITGTGFTSATLVSFGTTPQPVFSVASPTQIATTVPAGASTGTVSVTTPAGTGTSSTPFTVTTGGGGGSAPTVTKLTPASGSAGTPVTITGTGFTGATAVLFGKLPQSKFVVVSATSITTTVPAGAATGVVSVTTPAGTGVSPTPFTLPRGTFAAPVSFSASALAGIAAGDANRDGKVDLVAAVPGGNQVLVLLGKGDGTFTAGTTVTASLSAPTAVSLADVNKDGKLDLVVVDAATSNQLLVFLGDGAGGFAAPQTTGDAAASSPGALALGDLTGDGYLDAVFGVATSGGVAGADVAVNQSATAPPTFPAAATALAIGGTPPAARSALLLGNLRGAGKLDLAVASDAAAPLLFPGNGDGTFGASASIGTGAVVVSLAAADLDRNGSQDLVGADGALASSVFVFLDAGGGSFPAQASYSTGAAHSVGVAVGDVDGDGIQDVVTANGDGTVSVLIGKGDGTFKAATRTTGVANATAILLVDVNGDGKLDVVVAGANGGAVLLGN